MATGMDKMALPQTGITYRVNCEVVRSTKVMGLLEIHFMNSLVLLSFWIKVKPG